jgi:TusA-related sulfurtransferase
MSEMIDVRGLSCPQPVLTVKQAVDSGKTEIDIIVDDMAALRNIERYALNNNLSISKTNRGNNVILTIKKC